MATPAVVPPPPPPAGRLPPQAPSSSSRNSSSSRHRSRSSSADKSRDRESQHRSSRSSRGSGSGSGSRRVRSSSDGVRVMSDRYQQQQQQYYGGYQQQNGGNGYPMQYSNQPPPYGIPPQRGRNASFDAANARFADPNSNSNNHSNYGSIPPPPLPSNRPRTSSKEFSKMDEISSVIGGGGGSMRGLRSGPPVSPVGGRPMHHRRTMSDSRLLPHMPPIYQGNPLVMPNPNYNQPLRHRADSYGSQGSQHSYHSGSGGGYGAVGGGAPGGGDQMGVGEMEAFLAHYNMEAGAASGGNGNHYRNSSTGGRPKTHMRQHSVNLYMNKFKGEKQSRSYKDVLFAVLFVLQLVMMCVVGLKFGPEALVETAEDLGPGEGLLDDDGQMSEEPSGVEGADGEEDETIILAYQNIIKMAYTCGAFAIIVSALALAFMMAMSRRLVYVALVLSIGVSFAWGTIGIGISPKSFVPITGIIALMLTVGYMFVVWDRIPFASANLTTALTGVRDNLGLVGVAFFFQFLALVCSIYYSFTFVGLHDAMNNGQVVASDHVEISVDVLLLVSYYWTFQVLRHIVMVTVAGTIGSWWFDKPSAIKETFLHATVYNFGSICYGSLFVGPVQFLRQITEGLRPNRDDSAMMCLYECSVFLSERIVGCVDNLADSFTPWAFTYVGLYHYGLKDAGHKANELFERRGWSRIVTDDLISSVLAMVGLVIGGLTGSFAVILQALDGHGLTNFGHPVLTSFTIGFLVGIVLSAVLFSIIDSSVCAVIICFAGSPVEFHRNHAELSHEMRHAWKEVWPGSLDIDELRVGLT